MSARLLHPFLTGLALLAGPLAACAAPTSWPSRLEAELEALDRASPGELGVWVKRLADDQAMGYQAGRPWYLSSTIKVPVAIALLEKVEAGKVSLDDKLTLAASDFVDGAGEVQGKKPGTKLSVAYLLEKMLVQSDSTAADMLIRLVGVEDLNALLEREGFGRATTLLQVRHDAYGELHPGAARLTNLDYLEIHRAGGWEARQRTFAAKVGARPDDLRAPSVGEAFERYYRRGLNSASLEAFGRLLEKLSEGKLLSPEHTALVLSHMQAMTTGERRLKAGLPKGVRFAQKTGTQIRRVCNMGIVEPGTAKAVVIAACVEKFPDQAAAEGVLERVGSAVARSGALSAPQ
jgi:beta-lactamase class A